MLLAVHGTAFAAHASPEADIYLAGPSLTIAGLSFTIPYKWIAEPPETAARAGQWRVPSGRGQEGSGQVVALTFGPGLGGSAKDNIEGWINTMSDSDGHPAAAEVKHREVGGLKISQVVVFGTYDEEVPLPGIPPQMRPNYGLVGIVLENPAGTIFWRFTGPEALVTANLPLIDKMVDTARRVAPKP
jgi:hypothetical protein